jgi:hypothetical protein
VLHLGLQPERVLEQQKHHPGAFGLRMVLLF